MAGAVDRRGDLPPTGRCLQTPRPPFCRVYAQLRITVDDQQSVPVPFTGAAVEFNSPRQDTAVPHAMTSA